MNQKELNKIAKDPAITHCYISKGSYYRPGAAGYTDFRHKAGVFEKMDAIDQAEGCKDLWLEPIDIKKHNAMLIEEAKEIISRFIPDINATDSLTAEETMIVGMRLDILQANHKIEELQKKANTYEKMEEKMEEFYAEGSEADLLTIGEYVAGQMGFLG